MSQLPVGEELLRHRRTGTVHRRSMKDSTHLACGRLVCEVHAPVARDGLVHACGVCFSRAGIEQSSSGSHSTDCGLGHERLGASSSSGQLAWHEPERPDEQREGRPA